jgi:hypothetical protein
MRQHHNPQVRLWVELRRCCPARQAGWKGGVGWCGGWSGLAGLGQGGRRTRRFLAAAVPVDDAVGC